MKNKKRLKSGFVSLRDKEITRDQIESARVIRSWKPRQEAYMTKQDFWYGLLCAVLLYVLAVLILCI
jgi:hypothetical protein